MARIARAVVPSLPHHVVQRGNRRQRTFFRNGDYLLYAALLREWCDRRGVEVWAYCLMPNHSHLIAVPESPGSLRLAIGEAHRRYTKEINRREGWRGHLWQERFRSYVMDERYTLLAARYIELNPVRGGIVASPSAYPWSSARAHLAGRDDQLALVAPLLARVADWASFLRDGDPSEGSALIRKHENTGRPLGTESFVNDLERSLGRVLTLRRRGRKPKTA
jgi:putative transposase